MMMSYKQVLHDAPDAGLVYVPYHLPRLTHDFARQVAPLTEGVMQINIPGPGLIERLAIRIYQGAQLNLRINPYLVRPRQNLNLINYVTGGKQFVDGDDDNYIYNLSIECNQDDALAVWFSNLQATHAYDFRVSVEINYAAGAGVRA